MKNTNKNALTRALLLVIGLLSYVCCQAYDFEVDGIYYSILSASERTCMVTKGDVSYSGEITIPEKVSYRNIEFTVTGLDYAFSNYSKVKKVNLPNTLTKIGFGEFRTSYIEEIAIPNSVVSIGTEAFYKCYYLKKCTLGNGLKSIGDGVFWYCELLEQITFPNSLTSIGKEAFEFSGLTSVVVPNSVDTIGDFAFYYCEKLQSVELAGPLSSLGYGTFCGCTSLTKVVLPEKMRCIVSTMFNNCKSLADIRIPNSVTQIGKYAFSGTGLTSVTIPGNVSYIGEEAFKTKKALNSVTSLSIQPPTAFDNTFLESSYLFATLYVPQGSLEAYKEADGWKNFLNIQEIATSGIDTVDDNTNDIHPLIYDMQGRRLEKPLKGVNVINGKKVIVK